MAIIDQSLSLFIPKVFPNFDEKYIIDSVSHLGDVSRVDMVARYDKEGNTYNAVYIHFNCWNNTDECEEFQMRLLADDGTVHLYHNPHERWYWVVLPNKAKKHTPGARKPRIDLGDVPSINMNMIDFPVLTNNEAKFSQSKNTSDSKDNSKKISELFNATNGEVVSFDQEKNVEDEEASEIYSQMDEIEALLTAEDANLVSIDARYIATLEQENISLRQENIFLMSEALELKGTATYLHQMYLAELAKCEVLRKRLDDWEESMSQGP